MTPPQQNPAHLFESYFGPSLFQPWARKIIESANVQPGESVLDLATATGTVARFIAANGQNKVHGLDFSADMLEVAMGTAAQEGVDVEWYEGSADDMPYDDGQFDVVISQQGLQFFPDREAAAKEIYRVLKPGGRLVASVWQDISRHPVWQTMFDSVAKRLDAPMTAAALPFMMGDQGVLVEYVKSGGFTDVTVTEESHVVRFPEPDRFIQLSVTAAGAAVPTFREMSDEARSAAIREISENLSDSIGDHVQDGHVVMPSYLNQVVAVK